MSSPTPDALKAEQEIANSSLMKVGNEILAVSGSSRTTYALLYSDADKKMAELALDPSNPLFVGSDNLPKSAGFPFAVPLHAGVEATSNSILAIEGRSTYSADEIMHQTLVDGAGVTTFTKTGFVRVSIIDNAGNITNGAHYIQIGTLS